MEKMLDVSEAAALASGPERHTTEAAHNYRDQIRQ
jgi:hypothetical protein